jgi:hypothetical protein
MLIDPPFYLSHFAHVLLKGRLEDKAGCRLKREREAAG